MISLSSKIYVAGHKGMAGSSCWRILQKSGYHNLIGHTKEELNLMKQLDVDDFFERERPDVVIDAAAKVGGILANDTYPYDFLMNNMLIQNNLIKASLENNVTKFIFLGSSCIYPRLAQQPLKEEYLLTSPLEPTNQWYAIAKISGLKLIESIRAQFGRDYVSLMPTNLYGLNDTYDMNNSHVIPSMIMKFHNAKINNLKEVVLFGTGNPLREFLNVDDLAEAILVFLKSDELKFDCYNVGSGEEISIKSLAELIKDTVCFKGDIKWDESKPDGTPRKLVDSGRIHNLGWKPKLDLKTSIGEVYLDFINRTV